MIVPIWQGQPAQPNRNIVVRSYKGKLEQATRHFQADAASMAAEGWFPMSQQYQPGSWGCGAFLVAVLLMLLLVGFLIFVYMIVVKPAGVLVVTYEFRGKPEVPMAEVPTNV